MNTWRSRPHDGRVEVRVPSAGRVLYYVRRERNPERPGHLLVEHQLLDGDFLERDIARLLAAQDAGEHLRRRFPGLVPTDADRDQRSSMNELGIVDDEGKLRVARRFDDRIEALKRSDVPPKNKWANR